MNEYYGSYHLESFELCHISICDIIVLILKRKFLNIGIKNTKINVQTMILRMSQPKHIINIHMLITQITRVN